MKITIEFSSTTHAKLNVDGKDFEIIRKYCVSQCVPRVDNNSLGELIIYKLQDVVSDIMQATGCAWEFDPDKETWETLNNEAFDEAEKRL